MIIDGLLNSDSNHSLATITGYNKPAKLWVSTHAKEVDKKFIKDLELSACPAN